MSGHGHKLLLHWGTVDEAENINKYTQGGYHPVQIGQIYISSVARYRVLHKLGHGSFATVWLARKLEHEVNEQASPNCFVALKICAAAADAQHELLVHDRLSLESGRHIIQVLDHFSHSGPNGVHTIIIYEVLGSTRDIGKVVEKQRQQLCRQVAQGIAFLHRQGVIHGDIHSGNIGVRLPTLDQHSEKDIMWYFQAPEVCVILPNQPVSEPDRLPPYLVPPIDLSLYLEEKDLAFVREPLDIRIMDLGGAVLPNETPRPSCTPHAVCAPEILFQLRMHKDKPPPPSTFESDIWSLACTMWEVVFGHGAVLFGWAGPDDTTVEKMARVCGHVPEYCRREWDASEYLAGKKPISPEAANVYWQNRLGIGEDNKKFNFDVEGFSSLLRSMLKMDPEARPTAEEVLRHPFLAVDDSDVSK